MAIKIIHKDNKLLEEIELIREMVKMYQLAIHYNVVRLEDHFEDKSKFYLCFELHSHETLYSFVQNNNIGEIRVREIAQKIGETLEYFHDNGILVRNLESSSILMTDTRKKNDLTDTCTSTTAEPKILKLDQAIVQG